MTLRVIGAGMPRTGTTSLKAAFEHLLDGRCYHMVELFENRENGLLWWQALQGDKAALTQVLDGYIAAVDWPASLFWRELVEEHPDAVVVMSHREDAETWWRSADKTVWAMMRRPDTDQAFAEFNVLMRDKAGLGENWDDPASAMASYDALLEEVTNTVPGDRLVLWKPSQGWGPLCDALDMAVPDRDFFYKNTTAEFREQADLE